MSALHGLASPFFSAGRRSASLACTRGLLALPVDLNCVVFDRVLPPWALQTAHSTLHFFLFPLIHFRLCPALCINVAQPPGYVVAGITPQPSPSRKLTNRVNNIGRWAQQNITTTHQLLAVSAISTINDDKWGHFCEEGGLGGI